MWVFFFSVVVVQSLSHVWLLATPGTAALQASLSFTISGACSNSCPNDVSDAIQPYCPLSSPSPAFNLSQHQGLFQWVGSSHQVNRVLSLSLTPRFYWIRNSNPVSKTVLSNYAPSSYLWRLNFKLIEVKWSWNFRTSVTLVIFHCSVAICSYIDSTEIRYFYNCRKFLRIVLLKESRFSKGGDIRAEA